MSKQNSSILYFLAGIYTVMISWFYYHSIFLAIVNWFFWPISLLYFLLTGKLADEMWLKIPQSYF